MRISSSTWPRDLRCGAHPEITTSRIDAPIVYDFVGGQLLMFGGQDASGDRNDLWGYSVDRPQWMVNRGWSLCNSFACRLRSRRIF
jgi:hypothetical protein